MNDNPDWQLSVDSVHSVPAIDQASDKATVPASEPIDGALVAPVDQEVSQ
ncbi:hypothetical protein LN050_10115 [Comamonadaceae bacterium M7527]|nr:hypothetical protein LN050_10115 [Comamonadaceae bacterium M7527]